MCAYYDSPSPCTEKLLTVNDCFCVGVIFLIWRGHWWSAWKEEGHDGKEKVVTEFRVSQCCHGKTIKMNKEEQEEEQQKETKMTLCHKRVGIKLTKNVTF